MNNYSGMVSFCTAGTRTAAAPMMSELEIIHYAVSPGHHHSLVYLIQTEDLANSSYRLEEDELEKFRDVAMARLGQ